MMFLDSRILWLIIACLLMFAYNGTPSSILAPVTGFFGHLEIQMQPPGVGCQGEGLVITQVIHLPSSARGLRLENTKDLALQRTPGCKALTFSHQEDRLKLASIWGSRNHKIIKVELKGFLNNF